MRKEREREKGKRKGESQLGETNEKSSLSKRAHPENHRDNSIVEEAEERIDKSQRAERERERARDAKREEEEEEEEEGEEGGGE